MTRLKSQAGMPGNRPQFSPSLAARSAGKIGIPAEPTGAATRPTDGAAGGQGERPQGGMAES
jgi:hypothetical protein